MTGHFSTVGTLMSEREYFIRKMFACLISPIMQITHQIKPIADVMFIYEHAKNRYSLLHMIFPRVASLLSLYAVNCEPTELQKLVLLFNDMTIFLF